jgi:hypothetical protein
VRRVRGCLLGNRGADEPPQEALAEPPREPLAGLQGLTAQGLPFGTRERRFVSLCELRPSAWRGPLTVRRRSHGRPCASRRPPARLHYWHSTRKRSQRASWILSHLALLPGAGRLHVGCGWRHPRPVATDDGRMSHTRHPPGISPARPRADFLLIALPPCQRTMLRKDDKARIFSGLVAGTSVPSSCGLP